MNPISDLTYRGYNGPLDPPRRRWWVIGRVSTMTEDTGKAIGTINNATKSLADEAVQLRGATQSLIQRLQAA